MVEVKDAAHEYKPDAIVYNITTAFIVTALAEKLEIPIFGSYTLPLFPTSEFAPPILGMTSTGFGKEFSLKFLINLGFLNSMIHSALNWMSMKMTGEDINWWRNELGLKPIQSTGQFLNMPIPIYHL
jgi:hypothetical protein